MRHKKWIFPLRISSVNVTKSVETADLVGFTEGILNGKLNFLRSVKCDKIITSANWYIWRANKITGYYFKRIVSRKRVYPISKKYFEPNQTSMMELFAEKVIKVHHRCWTRFHEQLCISFNLSFSESKPYFDSLSRHKNFRVSWNTLWWLA